MEEASAIHTVWILWSCIYHEFKNIFEEKTVSPSFRVYSRLGLHTVRSMNALVVFFAAFAKVQVAVLLVLNLLRQGFSATCPIGHCCVCSPLLFASELLCDSPGNSPKHSKQRMNKMSPSRWPCCLETENARCPQAKLRL